MEAIEDPLDFEFEEASSISPAINKKKKKKIIGLDDLLADYYKEKSKVVERESKRAKTRKTYDSDEDIDEDVREAQFSECLAKCQKEMGQISGDDETPMWGLQVFGNQKTFPPVGFPDIGSCELLQSFKDHKLNLMVGLEIEKGETFLEGLLMHGWLLKLVYITGQLEKSLATWTFNLMLYSPKEVLRVSAWDFWCAILLPKDEVSFSMHNQADILGIRIDWLPSYSELKRALQIYGFQLDSLNKLSSDVEMVCTGSNSPGPPQNIREWMKYVAVCCQIRNTWGIFSTSDAEDFIVVVVSLSLDRVLLGLSVILDECLHAAISFFKDDEWSASCLRVAKSLASRLPTDANCLRVLESISGVNARSKHLRAAMAFQFLVSCSDNKVLDAEDMLSHLISINMKDQNCDLFKVYIYLSLAENWLLFDPLLEDKQVMCEMWGVFLRNCSCQITSRDSRPFASKVRIKASYILQGTSSTYSGKD